MPEDINSTSNINNPNLSMRSLTIDDVIIRAMILSEPDYNQITQEQYEREYRKRYGREVFGGKVVIVRSDLNSTVTQEDGVLKVSGERIPASVPTIRELSNYGAKVVIMVHQGTQGTADCISLEPHKKALEELLRQPVLFYKAHWYGSATIDIITNKMKPGDVFLLDNVRKLADETSTVHEPAKFATLPDSHMETLGKLATFFVNDAFSVSHRWHGSIVGFPYILNIAGRLFQKEIKENQSVNTSMVNVQHPYTLLLGGVKIVGYIDFVEELLRRGLADHVLAGGALGVLATLDKKVQEQGIELGVATEQFLREKNVYHLLSRVGVLAREKRFVTPVDFKVELDGHVYIMTPARIHRHKDRDKIRIYGIGPETAEQFSNILRASKTIYIKGSPVKNDDDRLLEEAKKVFGAVVEAKQKGAITILSGGDTGDLIAKTGYSKNDLATYSTSAGGAAAEYQAGTVLPGVLMLDASYKAFWDLPLESGWLPGFRPTATIPLPNIPQGLRPFRTSYK